jgi:hypothetical protein
VFLQAADTDKEFKLMMQATSTKAQSPLQAEAKALLFASSVAVSLQLHGPAFLSDNLILAKAAAARRPAWLLNWEIRGTMIDFYLQSSPMKPAIFHILRNLDGVAHNCAQQVPTQSLQQHVFRCINPSHGNQ